MKILICGGTRFYGIRLVEQLSQANYEVYVVSSRVPHSKISGVCYIEGKLGKETEEIIKNQRYDFCVNNICMNKEDAENYIRYISKYVKNHIMISSIGVYESGLKNKIPDEGSYQPDSDVKVNEDEPYFDKREAERTLMKALKNKNLYILRPSVLIGKKDWTDRLGFYIQRLLDGHGIITSLDGENYFHWTFDFQLAAVVEAIIKDKNKYCPDVYNVAVNQYFKFIDFLKIIGKILNIKEIPILSMQKAGLTKVPYEKFRDPYGKEDCVCNTEKLKNLMGDLLGIQLEKLAEIVQERASMGDIMSPNYEKRFLEIEYIKEHEEFLEIINIS